ncbi:MAG TPA: hypothetical protein VHP37_02590 [Burkholderiales bacterium]|nr:hypothetical protein [Burkholderiales bacterium]
MSANPYATPEAPVEDPPRKPGSPVKAVLAGLAIDVGGSLLVGVLMTILYAGSLASRGMSDDEIAAALAKAPDDPAIFIVGSLAGGALSLLGGFVAARIARRDEYRVGAILAALAALIGFGLSWDAYTPIQNALLTLLTAGAVMLGVRLGRVPQS